MIQYATKHVFNPKDLEFSWPNVDKNLHITLKDFNRVSFDLKDNHYYHIFSYLSPKLLIPGMNDI